MHSLKELLTVAALGSLVACGGSGSAGAAPDQPDDNAASVAEKVSFSTLARDMIAVSESEAPWDVSQYDIDMDIDEYAAPTAFDDLLRAQP